MANTKQTRISPDNVFPSEQLQKDYRNARGLIISFPQLVNRALKLGLPLLREELIPNKRKKIHA